MTTANNKSAPPRLIDKVLLPHTAWMLLLLIPITFLGFYPTYYSTFKAPFIIHLHAVLMGIWLAMAVTQPWLIKTGQFRWHKFTGRLSYALIPAILIVGYFVLRHGYIRVLGGDVIAPPEYYPADAAPMSKAADFVLISSIYFTWLLIYYAMGIAFRRRTFAHATFMLAAILTILGPSGDRLIWHIYVALGWNFPAVAEYYTFFLVFIIFGALLIYHRKKKLQLWPTITVLAIHLTGVVMYYAMPFHPVWDKLAAALFSPG